MNTLKTLAIGGLVGVAFAGAAMVLTPLAHADEDSFTYALESDGLATGPTALTLGHSICTDILRNGVDGVEAEVIMGLKAGFSVHDTDAFIVDATMELCPAAVPYVRSWANQYPSTLTSA